MSNPTITCTHCGRTRDCTLHMRSEFPPDAAKKWLRKTCEANQVPYAKPCEFTYRAGIDQMLEAQVRALRERAGGELA